MDVLLQRHCAKFIYVVPDGLRELMTDISREVIRTHPENIYLFVADYLDALMITRENARVAAKVVESLTQIAVTIVTLLINIGMTREEADKTATIIQRIFRQYLEEKKTYQKETSEQIEEANLLTDIITEAGITPEQAEGAAEIIQKSWRDFKKKHEREKHLLAGLIDWRIAARSAIRLYRKTGVTYEEANRAATLIKAAYKGYYTRRMIKKLLEESQRLSETPSLASLKTEVEEEEEEEGELYWDLELYTDKSTDREDRELEKVSFEEELPYEVPSQLLAAQEVISDLLRATVPSPTMSLDEMDEYYQTDAEEDYEHQEVREIHEGVVEETGASQEQVIEVPQQAVSQHEGAQQSDMQPAPEEVHEQLESPAEAETPKAEEPMESEPPAEEA